MGIEVFCESKHDDPFANLRFNVGEQAAHVRARDVGDLFAEFIAPLRYEVLAHAFDHFDAVGIFCELPFRGSEDAFQAH